MFFESWRSGAQVYNHIQNGSGDASYQFGLGERRFLEVQSAKHAVPGFGFIVLQEFDFPDGFFELRLVEGFKKITAGIAKDGWFDEEEAWEGGGVKYHLVRRV
jgi:hypothetical protein